jgi:hypothetical protein
MGSLIFIHPSPFLIRGMLLMWIGGPQIYAIQNRPLARMKRYGMLPLLCYKSSQDYNC